MKVAIIGSGQMGRGIAEASALAGHDVLLIDKSSDALDKAREIITLNLVRAQSKQRIDQDTAQATLARIKSSTKLTDLAHTDLCIEAINENEAAKFKILRQSRKHLSDQAIVASNTSSISITRLASVTKHPDRFIGMHFMNPVPKMKLVEVIRGLQTSPETFNFTLNFIQNLEKEVAVSEDFPAFIVNRILIPMINEAVLALYEGVANVENIDKAMKLGANHPQGPLELADYIGLDTVLSVLQVLYEGLADSKYRPCPLLNRYVEAGWLGKKTGRGFYDYSGDTPVPTR